MPDNLPLEFQAYMGKSAGRITIPPQLRSDLGITPGDIAQFTILAKRAAVYGGWRWVEFEKHLTTCVKVQKRYVIRVPEILKRAIGFRGGRDVLVRLEKVVRGADRPKPRSKCAYIRKEHIDEFRIKQGDTIQVTVVATDDTPLPEEMQLTATTKMQENQQGLGYTYIPKPITSYYGGKRIKVRVDKAVHQKEVEG